ncbi:hypothetical protein EVAR_81078_1 [Eumeta japonica]|uniref:Uncharacterized protein n=1 Tax=Eumeta variegata TaxID=151549 RepID=A0A4C1T6J2_EUMVA|nr:hypothetical protein EVAR_81078_1 [Eumeta japonica]
MNAFTHFCIGGITIVCCIYGVHMSSASPSFRQHIILCVIGGMKNKELKVDLFMDSANVDILCIAEHWLRNGQPLFGFVWW